MNQDKYKISVRLNGKEQTVKEPKQDKLKVGPSVLKDDDITNQIVAAREDELGDTEEIIPKPDNVIDFGRRHEERVRNGQPYWDDGNRENSPKLPYKRKKKPFSNVNRPKIPIMLIVAIFSAIVVGLGFGTVILTVFTGNNVSVGDSEEVVAIEPTETPTVSEEGGLPTLNLEIVQGGAFKEMAKGEEVAARIQEQGLASTLTQGTDPIYMFIGAGGDRAQANKIGQLYESYGQDTYLKTYRVEGQNITGQAENVSAWFTNAITQYKEILQLSVDGLSGGSLITVDRVKQIEEKADLLLSERDQAFSHLSGSSQEYALIMGDNLVIAGKKLTEFQSSKEPEALWKSQQALLDALVNYEQVIQSMQ
jgi:stage II sporulation protein B